MSSKFLAFPREIRDQIYGEVFAFSDGIHLNKSRQLKLRGRDDYFDIFNGLGSTEQLPGFLYSSRQILAEAVESLYRVNTKYTFTGSWLPEARQPRKHTATSHDILNFLESLPFFARRRVQELHFGADTFRNDEEGGVDKWNDLCDFLADPKNGFRLDTITIGVPISLNLDSDNWLAWAQHCRYWWPAAQELTRLLNAGVFRSLRLLHPRTYGPYLGKSTSPQPDEISAENYHAYSKCMTVRVREQDQAAEQRLLQKPFYETLALLDPNEACNPWEELDMLTSERPKLHLPAERDTSDPEGTVLVLRAS